MTVSDITQIVASLGFPIVMALLLWYERFRFSDRILGHEIREAAILEAIQQTLAELVAKK